jgi:hypothetical protein
VDINISFKFLTNCARPKDAIKAGSAPRARGKTVKAIEIINKKAISGTRWLCQFYNFIAKKTLNKSN